MDGECFSPAFSLEVRESGSRSSRNPHLPVRAVRVLNLDASDARNESPPPSTRFTTLFTGKLFARLRGFWTSAPLGALPMVA